MMVSRNSRDISCPSQIAAYYLLVDCFHHLTAREHGAAVVRVFDDLVAAQPVCLFHGAILLVNRLCRELGGFSKSNHVGRESGKGFPLLFDVGRCRNGRSIFGKSGNRSGRDNAVVNAISRFYKLAGACRSIGCIARYKGILDAVVLGKQG